jgi:hypothetical protein
MKGQMYAIPVKQTEVFCPIRGDNAWLRGSCTAERVRGTVSVSVARNVSWDEALDAVPHTPDEKRARQASLRAAEPPSVPAL